MTEPNLLIGQDCLDRTRPADWFGLWIWCLDRSRPTDWSSYIVWTEPGLLIGRDILFGLPRPAHWSRYIAWTEPGLLIGRVILFGQNLAC